MGKVENRDQMDISDTNGESSGTPALLSPGGLISHAGGKDDRGRPGQLRLCSGTVDETLGFRDTTVDLSFRYRA